MIPNVLETLVTSLSAFDEVRSVILFGSRAYGDADPRSDVDLAISAPRMNHRRWLNMKLLAEEAPTLLSITLVRLEDSPSELRERVLKEGIVLYEQEKGR
jgi:predicted nucleotidyltransferase